MTLPKPHPASPPPPAPTLPATPRQGHGAPMAALGSSSGRYADFPSLVKVWSRTEFLSLFPDLMSSLQTEQVKDLLLRLLSELRSSGLWCPLKVCWWSAGGGCSSSGSSPAVLSASWCVWSFFFWGGGGGVAVVEAAGGVGWSLTAIRSGGHSEGRTFNLVGEGGINSTVASLHSFIKCLTILRRPRSHQSPPPSLLLHPDTHTHTQAAESTHTHTHSIHVTSVCGCLCVCVWKRGLNTELRYFKCHSGRKVD